MSMANRYCFTDQEFSLLAGSLGIRSFYGLKPQEPLWTEDKELYLILFRMLKKGFLEAAEDSYLVAAEIRELFQCLKGADSEITVYAVDDRFPVKCIYQGKRKILIEPGGIQGKYFKCSCVSFDELWDIFCEENVLLPQNVADDILYDDMPMTEELLEEEMGRLLHCIGDWGGRNDMGELKKHGVHTVMEKRNMLYAELQGKILLIERSVYDLILVQYPQMIKIFRYSQRMLKELMSNWEKEGERE